MPPIRLSRDLLIRGVAYLLQVGAEGGLSLTTKRRLRTLSEGSDQRGKSVASPAIRLKPGTKLVREWHGQATAPISASFSGSPIWLPTSPPPFSTGISRPGSPRHS